MKLKKVNFHFFVSFVVFSFFCPALNGKFKLIVFSKKKQVFLPQFNLAKIKLPQFNLD